MAGFYMIRDVEMKSVDNKGESFNKRKWNWIKF